jgi:membrane associated rhomboid family serine protease
VRQASGFGALRRTAPLTLALIATTVALYVVTSMSREVRAELLSRFAQVNFLVAEGEVYRIVTPVLFHANGLHIFFNMFALYQLGPAVERRVGVVSYFGLYLSAATWGGAFAFWLGGSGDILVGASGAIFGLFGLWLHSAFRLRDTAFGRNLLSSLGVTLLINAALAFIVPGISWQGHLGGLIAGIILGELWSRIRKPKWRALAPLAMLIVAVVAVAL